MRQFSRNKVTAYHFWMLVIAICLQMLLSDGVWSAEPAKKIVLIGGQKSHGVGEHDFPNGIALFKEFLDTSPNTHGVEVVAYPDGWPTEASALEGTSTLVFYFDGVQGGDNSHPLFDDAHRAQFEELTKLGTGVVALHQASTVSANDTTINLPRWLGGTRYGMVDRTMERVLFKPASHPIGNGVGTFSLYDEFYPTIRFFEGGNHVTPILIGQLHPQFRDGKPLVIDKAERHPVAWAFERQDGGRAFTFTGLHYLAGLDNLPLRKLLLNAIFWTAKIDVPNEGVETAAPTNAAEKLIEHEGALATVPAGGKTGIDKLTYHYNSQRTGWNDHEVILTPEAVASASFGPLWETPTLDYFEGVPPRLFASPLYVDAVRITTGQYRDGTYRALYAATTTGYVYAITAYEAGDTLPGAILWRTRLTGKPCEDGTMGNLSTPVIDLRKQRLYVTSCSDAGQWQAHALDIGSGAELGGWPVNIDHDALNAPGINRNGNTQFSEKDGHIQRGALNLSPDGSRLYVSFGLDNSSGWIVAVDTTRARVATAFSTTAVTSEIQGGMWASGGPSVDRNGSVYIATGASFTQMLRHAGIPGVFPDSAHSWGQSILQLKDDPSSGFELLGSYTPFNYCEAAANDIDLGSSGTVVIDLDPNKTSTPHLLALGGAKQGNAYLLDRTHMPGGVFKRHPCSGDSSSDLSLLAPENQPQFGKRGPINVFGPYTDVHAALDQARSRTTLAYLHASTGEDFLYITGSSKGGADFSMSIPPGLAQVEIVTSRGKPAYLRVARLEQTQTFQNPGSPILTSSDGKNAIVWVLDMNAPRTSTLYGTHAPQPVLYAFDALSLKLLWKSAPGVLGSSGKYNEPTIVNGTVFVGADRIQAFGIQPAAANAATEEFKPLFDGKTLAHWRGDPTLWSVHDGAITGQSNKPIEKSTFLINDANYRDFELHFKYRFLTGYGNSGMQYRSRPFPEHEFSVAGYQANVVTLDAKERFAMLWDENSRGDLALLGEKTDVFVRNGKVQRRILGLVNPPETLYAAVKPYPEWNDYAVIAYGNHLVHAVNGVLAVDVLDNDFSGRAANGFFALQLHPGPPMGVQFKDILVKELTAAPDFTRQFVTHPAPPPSKLLTGDIKVLRMGNSVYEQRCAMCHSVKESGAPPKETLTQLPHEQIVNMLINGPMQDMALGLGDEEIQAVATYLTSQGAP